MGTRREAAPRGTLQIERQRPDRKAGRVAPWGSSAVTAVCMKYCEFSGVLATAKGRGVGTRAGVQIA
jgi:hypothetical protein